MNWLETARLYSPPTLKLPKRFQDATIEGIPAGPLKVTAERYVREFDTIALQGLGCLFLGRAGAYKTYAACAITRSIHATGLESVVVQLPIWIQRAERDRFSSAVDASITSLGKIPLVVLDDFSQIQPNSYGAGILLEVIEARFSNLLPTIYTGNIMLSKPSDAISAISSIYGPSLGRRIVESSKGFGAYV